MVSLSFKDASCIQEKSFRLIQLHVESKGEFLKKEWQDTILELFRYSADFFFYTDTDALLIEQKIVIILMLLRSMVFFYL